MRIGKAVGPYRVLDKLGEGGMELAMVRGRAESHVVVLRDTGQRRAREADRRYYVDYPV